MKNKKNRNLRRVKRKTRVRGAPIFGTPLAPVDKEKLTIQPETGMDVARLLSDEITKKWPEAKASLPMSISGKHVKLTRVLTEEFTGDVIKSMIRVLVWDFEQIKSSKAFFPPCASNHPWIDQLYNYRHSLSSVIGTGITDATSRTSAYAQRYLSGETPKATPTESAEAPKTEESMKDIMRRILGQ